MARRTDEGGDCLRRAFDAVGEALAAASLDDLEASLRPQFEGLGFYNCLSVQILGPGGLARYRLLSGRTYADWQEYYAEQGYRQHDPVVRRLLEATEPLFWSDVRRSRPLKPAEDRLYRDADEFFGLHEGFATPIHKRDGSLYAVVLLGEPETALDPYVRPTAHMLSLYYGSVGARLEETRHQTVRSVLSARERECLCWVREGKSSNDIGDLLGLSGRTVDYYLASACRKLGVRTRVQAVVEAARFGFLPL